MLQANTQVPKGNLVNDANNDEIGDEGIKDKKDDKLKLQILNSVKT